MILAIDTSAAQCAVATADGAVVLAEARERMERGHAERLFPMIEAALALHPLPLTRIAVCTGPGSFTGLRIGVAAARGLALGHGIPAVGITRFAALAAQVARPRPERRADRFGWEAGDIEFHGTRPRRLEEKVGWAERRPLAVALAGRGSTRFLQLLAPDLSALSDPALIDAADLAAAIPADAVRVGDGWEGVPGRGEGPGGAPLAADGLVDPGVLAILGLEATPDAPPAPLYLRGPDADLPREAPPAILDAPRG